MNKIWKILLTVGVWAAIITNSLNPVVALENNLSSAEYIWNKTTEVIMDFKTGEGLCSIPNSSQDVINWTYDRAVSSSNWKYFDFQSTQPVTINWKWRSASNPSNNYFTPELIDCRFAPYVVKAKDAWIIKGAPIWNTWYSSFNAKNNVTLYELWVMVTRAFNITSYKNIEYVRSLIPYLRTTDQNTASLRPQNIYIMLQAAWIKFTSSMEKSYASQWWFVYISRTNTYFTDVKKSDPYALYIKFAAESWILSWKVQGNNWQFWIWNITRDEFTKILYNVYKDIIVDSNLAVGSKSLDLIYKYQEFIKTFGTSSSSQTNNSWTQSSSTTTSSNTSNSASSSSNSTVNSNQTSSSTTNSSWWTSTIDYSTTKSHQDQINANANYWNPQNASDFYMSNGDLNFKNQDNFNKYYQYYLQFYPSTISTEDSYKSSLLNYWTSKFYDSNLKNSVWTSDKKVTVKQYTFGSKFELEQFLMTTAKPRIQYTKGYDAYKNKVWRELTFVEIAMVYSSSKSNPLSSEDLAKLDAYYKLMPNYSILY